ncbi:hypothetical protein ABPG75_005630 [Micractinium tetrahymenae]
MAAAAPLSSCPRRRVCTDASSQCGSGVSGSRATLRSSEAMSRGMRRCSAVGTGPGALCAAQPGVRLAPKHPLLHLHHPDQLGVSAATAGCHLSSKQGVQLAQVAGTACGVSQPAGRRRQQTLLQHSHVCERGVPKRRPCIQPKLE